MPDALILRAKRLALAEGTTLTELLVQGLESRVQRYTPCNDLPVCRAQDGLMEGASWDDMLAADSSSEWYR